MVRAFCFEDLDEQIRMMTVYLRRPVSVLSPELLAACALMVSARPASAQAPAPALRDDTLALAMAAAQWVSPLLPAGRRIALEYGTLRGHRVSGLVRNAEQGARIAAMFHARAVQGDSARGCSNTGCAPGEFDNVVLLSGHFTSDSTASVFLEVIDYPLPASRRGGDHGWVTLFRRSGAAWVFDRIDEYMAS